MAVERLKNEKWANNEWKVDNMKTISILIQSGREVNIYQLRMFGS